jgi:hypothetical protein
MVLNTALTASDAFGIPSAGTLPSPPTNGQADQWLARLHRRSAKESVVTIPNGDDSAIEYCRISASEWASRSGRIEGPAFLTATSCIEKRSDFDRQLTGCRLTRSFWSARIGLFRVT